jgi:hypothetical protein
MKTLTYTFARNDSFGAISDNGEHACSWLHAMVAALLALTHACHPTWLAVGWRCFAACWLALLSTESAN